jgi:hypothetical protein
VNDPGAYAPARYLTMQEAARRYGLSERKLFQLLAGAVLTRHRRAGDRRTYLEVAELERALTPARVDAPQRVPAGGPAKTRTLRV